MIGHGEAWGAISLANALPIGIGSAAAISLRATARVDRDPDPTTGDVTIQPDRSDTALVRRTLAVGTEAFSGGRPWTGRLRIGSSIPPGTGLKSSSAVSVAVLRAVAAAFGRAVPEVEIARLSAAACRSAGVSATGAFDDALAAASGGYVVVENETFRILRTGEMPPHWAGVLWIPDRTHAMAPTYLERFVGREGEARRVVQDLLDGRLVDGIERNGRLVEDALGYAYAPVRERLRSAGVIACGVSGLGPALAAVADRDRIDAVRAAAPTEGRTMVVRFPAPGERPGPPEVP